MVNVRMRWSKMSASALVLLGTLASTGVSHAQQPASSPWADMPQSRVRLLGGTDTALPGARVLLIEMTLQTGWKTYWRVPGDAGIPPTFDWTGSKNLGDVEVRYPAPTVFVDQGGTTIGYKTAVTFAVVTRPPDLSVGSEVRLELAFGICRDVCIPVEAKLSLDVPATAALPAGKLATAMALVPQRKSTQEASTGTPAITSVAATLDGASPKLIIRAPGASDVFIEAPGSLFVPLALRAKGAKSFDVFEVDLTKTQDLEDLKGKTLTLTATGTAGAIETTWTMPKKR